MQTKTAGQLPTWLASRMPWIEDSVASIIYLGIVGVDEFSPSSRRRTARDNVERGA